MTAIVKIVFPFGINEKEKNTQSPQNNRHSDKILCTSIELNKSALFRLSMVIMIVAIEKNHYYPSKCMNDNFDMFLSYPRMFRISEINKDAHAKEDLKLKKRKSSPVGFLRSQPNKA